MNFMNCLKTASLVSRQSARNYAFKSDLKIKWNRPEKISCIRPEKSGDLSKLPAINQKDPLFDFQDSKELKDADENVKAIFRLENNPKIHSSNLYRDMMIKEVQRHPLDLGSMEAKLAKMTATIRIFQDHMEKFPRDKKIKVLLKEKIDKRKKFLKYLRRWDYKRFEWMLEKLDLVYKSPPSEFHWITRKESLKKLTDIHCETFKQEKLAEYRNSLQAQQIPFLEEKIKNLEFIRTEQQECQVPVTVSQDEINAVKKQLQDLKASREEAETNNKTS
ncbi:28S ribosomal protein S15, mitochondrial [Eupeodes corollae]|uniref:28S ribosomal protein S15, mitochondrial n=1 Tax=Eupeodes corollae TaxID=290404 RepID=UPI0024933A54|nr:28S ribosomal protein S15, mitochondrial [Eupeodes corollae]